MPAERLCQTQTSPSHNATGQKRETISNTSGTYRFANVGVGTYTLTVVAKRFQKYTKTGIVVNVAATVEADAAMAVGSQISNGHRGCRRIAGSDRNQRSQHADQRRAGLSSSQPTAVISPRLAALGLGCLKQPAAVWRCQCADLRERHQLQRNTHHAQHLHD